MFCLPTRVQEAVFPVALKRCPKEERGGYQDLSDKGDGGGACSQAHVLYKFAAGLVKVATSQRHQLSLMDFDGFECFSRYEEMQELGS